MPAKKKLPIVKDMESWVLISMQDLGGETHFRRIDRKCMELLVTSGVSHREASKTIRHNRLTSHNLKTSACRTKLREQGFVERTNQRGCWRLTEKGEERADTIRTQLKLHPATSKAVNDLASQANIKQRALQVLRDNDVSEEVITEFLQRLLDSVTIGALNRSNDDSDNLEVEESAIKFILKEPGEEGWHRTPRGNPGFDLYKTESGRKNGKKNIWCEVKSLRAGFSSVSLTPTEFLKAQECGDSYWLYIVEYAMSDNPKLLRVKNPAGQTRQNSNGKTLRLAFGRGWRHSAET